MFFPTVPLHLVGAKIEDHLKFSFQSAQTFENWKGGAVLIFKIAVLVFDEQATKKTRTKTKTTTATATATASASAAATQQQQQREQSINWNLPLL